MNHDYVIGNRTYWSVISDEKLSYEDKAVVRDDFSHLDKLILSAQNQGLFSFKAHAKERKKWKCVSNNDNPPSPHILLTNQF